MANEEHEKQGPLGEAMDASTSSTTASAEAAEEEQVRATERARLYALVHGDLVVAGQLHAEDFQLISPSGAVLSKEQYLAAIASRDLIYQLWEPESPIAVRLYDGVALIRYRSRLDGIAGGQAVWLRRYWHTDAYERRNGQWQCVWSQATEIR